jgi:hypothetical protein
MRAGDNYVLGGFPSILRTARKTDLDLNFLTFQYRIDNASSNHVSLHLASEDWYFPGGGKLDPQPDLGGMSGGPIFRRLSSRLIDLELGAILYQAQTSFELIRGRQASLIDAHGQITPP